MIFAAVILDWQKWEIGEATTPLLINPAQLLVVVLLAASVILSAVMFVRLLKSNRLRAALLALGMSAVVLSFVFLPLFEPAIKINYCFNQYAREKTVRLLDEGKLEQTDMAEFRLPFWFRLASHTGRIEVQPKIPYSVETDKVLFYVHCGYSLCSAVIYSADGITVKDGDFGMAYKTVTQVNPNWYIVTMVRQKI